ncbi:unnamed protein product, partial [Prorocentrum cordatum]
DGGPLRRGRAAAVPAGAAPADRRGPPGQARAEGLGLLAGSCRQPRRDGRPGLGSRPRAVAF